MWAKKFNEDAPKTHNLIFLYTKLELEIPIKIREILDELNKVSIPTRYPETLDKLFSIFPKDKTKEIIDNSQECLKWLKNQI